MASILSPFIFEKGRWSEKNGAVAAAGAGAGADANACFSKMLHGKLALAILLHLV